MTNFKDALAKGMQAHERATIARREIADVLAKATEEIASFLNTAIMLRIDVVDRPSREQTRDERRVGMAAPRERVMMLVVEHPNKFVLISNDMHEKRESLAEVQFAEVGFPVTLRWDHEHQQASNRQEFEQVLNALFASASTGEKLSKLVGQAG